MKIPLRLYDWKKVKKTGRGYTRRERTVVSLLREQDRKKRISTFLNVGFHDYQDVRNRWWIDICRANSIDWYILEIFESNVKRFLQQAPEKDHHRIVLGDLRNIKNLFKTSFDVILHWHGPEHLEREGFLQILPDMVEMTNNILILGCPNGEEEQGESYGNPWEKHISFWTVGDFHQLGFQTTSVSDKTPGHITAHMSLLE